MFKWLIIGAMAASSAAAEDAEALSLRAARAYDAGDSALAALLWRQSAKAGAVDAMTAYAGLLEEGDGLRADPEGAARWYARAARRGDAHAMVLLAEIHLARDPHDPRAKALFQEAADRGHPFARRRLEGPPSADDAVLSGVKGDQEQ